MNPTPLREFYQRGGCTNYRLREIESIEERAWTVLSSIPERYNSCCSPRAAAVSFGRPRQPATSPIDKSMRKQTQIRRCRFDAFDTYYALVSNEKSQEGKAYLTRLTHLTSNRRGCTWRVRPRPLARSPVLLDTPLSIGVKCVKRVKSPTQYCDSFLTFGVKPGVNLTPIPVDGVAR